ncbi:MAG: HAD-IA family hydrolase [Clostridiales bacterium]|nr:HAD-IA family hydrolase [Clostridiales bacterium]
MRTRYDTVIFDLDGTLLNTLGDLTAAANHALRESGYPERTMEEVRRFVGNGVGMLIRRALPTSADSDEEAFEETLQAFKSYYARHNNDTTAPYPGILEMLERLKQAEVRMAIVSNKNDPNVKALAADYFEPWIGLAVGEREGVRRKPNPDAVFAVMRAWNCDPAATLYVGDSGVDLETARNAGVDCVAVCWGFRSEEELRQAGATMLAHSPAELADGVLNGFSER